jgi:acetolactate synthase-1/2/3 large subunit
MRSATLLHHFPPRAVFASSSTAFHSSALLRQAAAAPPPPPPSLADAAQQIVDQDTANLDAASLSHDDERFVGMTGAEILHDLLKAHKVDQVFGYPGGAILPVFDAIYETKDFNFVLPRHEQGGGHMAEGYARVTGKPGVVIVTSGPGATNVVTPLQDALMDGTPMVVFTGQVPTAAIGTDAFQEADVVGITRSCTKWNCLVKDLKDLPQRINEAFHVATSGRPGPVLVDLPKDVTAGILSEVPNSEPRVATRMQKYELDTECMGS